MQTNVIRAHKTKQKYTSETVGIKKSKKSPVVNKNRW